MASQTEDRPNRPGIQPLDIEGSCAEASRAPLASVEVSTRRVSAALAFLLLCGGAALLRPERSAASPVTTTVELRETAVEPAAELRETAVEPAACANLVNHGTHATISIGVGTPPQYVDMVADTGSNAVVVVDCVCHDRKKCIQGGKCFRHDGRSSTFEVGKTPGSLHRLTYGSGDIDVVIGTDVVRVGNLSTTMDDGLMLVVDESKFQAGVQIDGILGLGKPRPKEKTFNGLGVEAPQFLQQADISRFSLCFNEAEEKAILRLGGPAVPLPLLASEASALHWSLQLRGLSVGAASAPAAICGAGCTAIPDSGTTMIMGPQPLITKLYAQLCHSWRRCQQIFAKIGSQINLGPTPEERSANIFLAVLAQCDLWLPSSSKGVNEVPSLFFHLSGGEQKTTIELTGWSYILETPAVANKRMCAPAFTSFESLKGDLGSSFDQVFVLGVSVFYEYIVHYDLGTTPPSLAFEKADCGSCEHVGSGAVPVVLTAQSDSNLPKRQPRVMNGNPRLPTWAGKLEVEQMQLATSLDPSLVI